MRPLVAPVTIALNETRHDAAVEKLLSGMGEGLASVYTRS